MAFTKPGIELFHPGSFEPENHYYSRVLNAQLHPLVFHFFNLTAERLIHRYCHLNPTVDREAVRHVLSYRPQYLSWAGVDLFTVTTAAGHRQMVLIETNSCASGQKSMPPVVEGDEDCSYSKHVSHCLRPLIERTHIPGALAVLYDKNYMENTGYAATLAEEFQEPVYAVPYPDRHTPGVSFDEQGLLRIQYQGQWIPIRAAFRYVTQKPWDRIPLKTQTLIVNPVLACLAGGRNKMVASKAYHLFNAEFQNSGLHIRIPETVSDVHKEEIPLLVEKFGGHAVIKIPYSNAGQGVFTITSPLELEAFMKMEHGYEQFIVQSLIGNSNWSSTTQKGKLYHVGTVPDRHNQIYVADLRIMGCSTPAGQIPLAIYGRRARKPLLDRLGNAENSWDVLGTNLSYRDLQGGWGTEEKRLLLMDRKDFNLLGLGIDDLIEGFLQYVMAVYAIDQMAQRLMTSSGEFQFKLFESLNKDRALLEEILLANPGLEFSSVEGPHIAPQPPANALQH